MRRAVLAIGCVVAACSSTPNGTLAITTGGEADALSRAPAPTTVIVEKLNTDGTVTELSRGAISANTDLSLGDVTKSDTGAIRVKAIDATGKVLVGGESLFFEFGALENATLELFLQRTGELARVPRPPGPIDTPLLDVVVGRYLVGVNGTATLLYDLLLLQPLSSAPVLTRAAKSFATYSTALVAIDEQGATSLDLSDASTAELSAPTGGTYAEIAGGTTVTAFDGSSYVVGATRSAIPSPRILKISSTGTLSFVALSSARAGACATWVEGRGLVVIGGDPTAPGVEIVSAVATAGAPLAFPADPVVGCGAATLDANHVVVAGGTGASTDTARVIDLACTANCAPVAWVGSLPFAHAQGLGINADGALFLGDDATGASRVFRVSSAEAHEIPLRVPRRGARMTVLPIAAAAIVGGASDIETYRE